MDNEPPDWSETKKRAKEIIPCCLLTGEAKVDWHHLHYKNWGKEQAWEDIIPLRHDIHFHFHDWAKAEKRGNWQVLEYARQHGFNLSPEAERRLGDIAKIFLEKALEREIQREANRLLSKAQYWEDKARWIPLGEELGFSPSGIGIMERMAGKKFSSAGDVLSFWKEEGVISQDDGIFIPFYCRHRETIKHKWIPKKIARKRKNRVSH
jgi:hypothetical protein